MPIFRRHSPRQVNNIVKNERKAQRIDTNPLKCLGVFAEHNPDHVYQYVCLSYCLLILLSYIASFSEPDYSQDPPTAFACGLKSDFSIQSLILYSRKNGCGLDSCYRYKNENRAPLTFLTTVNGGDRMLPGLSPLLDRSTVQLTIYFRPGSVYLSSDIKGSTMADFLEKTKEVVEKHAKDLVLGVFFIISLTLTYLQMLLIGKAEVCKGYRGKVADVLREARYIVKHGWKPMFIMIDKCRANMYGIKKGKRLIGVASYV